VSKAKSLFFCNTSSQGMTLIELMLVVTILGVIAIAATSLLQKNVAKARDGQRKNDLEILRSAAEHYYDDSDNEYPEEAEMNNADYCFKTDTFLAEYLKKFPCDPVTKLPYKYDRRDDAQAFYIFTDLANNDDSAIAEVGCSSLACGPDDDKNYDYGVSSTNVTVGVDEGGSQDDEGDGEDAGDGDGGGDSWYPDGEAPTSTSCEPGGYDYDAGCRPFGCYQGIWYRAKCNSAGDWCSPSAYGECQ